MKETTQKTMTRIECHVTNTPAILERLLRTVRVRGFSLERMEVKTSNQYLEVELSLYGERSSAMLINQLNKLIDVNRVYHLDQTTVDRLSA